MARKPRVTFEVRADNKTKTGLTGAKNSIKKFVAGGKAAFAAVAAGAAIAVVAIAAIGTALFKVGSSALEVRSKFSAVFGEASNSLNEFANSFSNMAGLTTSQTQGILANAGAIAQGMGFATDASADLAKQVVTLAGDLGSFNNLPTDDVAKRISSALTGETESLKQLGIVVKQTDIQERALLDTGKKRAADLTNQEKATATLALITERAGAAVGDLERTQNSAANTMKRIIGRVKQLFETVSILFTTILSGAGAFSGLAESLNTANEFLVENQQTIVAWGLRVGTVLKGVVAIFKTNLRIVFNVLQIAVKSLVLLGQQAILTVKNSLNNLIAVGNAAIKVINLVLPASKELKAIELIDTAGNEAAMDSLKESIKSDMGDIVEAFTEGREAVQGFKEELQTRDFDVDAQALIDERSVATQSLTGGSGGATGGGAAPEEDTGTTKFREEEFRGIVGLARTFESEAEALRKETELIDKILDEQMEKFGDYGDAAAAGFTAAFDAARSGLPVFAALASAIIDSIAQSSVVKASEQIALGVAALAGSLFGLNPKARAAAAKSAALHFKSAALFSGLAAAASVAGGGGAGGGIGTAGTTSPDSLRDARDASTRDRDKAIIIIEGGLLDMSDPKQAAALAAAIADVSDRDVSVQGAT